MTARRCPCDILTDIGWYPAAYHRVMCPEHNPADCMACRNPLTFPAHAMRMALERDLCAVAVGGV